MGPCGIPETSPLVPAMPSHFFYSSINCSIKSNQINSYSSLAVLPQNRQARWKDCQCRLDGSSSDLALLSVMLHLTAHLICHAAGEETTSFMGKRRA